VSLGRLVLRLPNPRFDPWYSDGWDWGQVAAPTIEVDIPEDEEVECLLDQYGEPIVHPKMRFGF
jgi:hypothetical protein